MIYKILFSKKYKKSYKRVCQQAGFPQEKLGQFVDYLACSQRLPEQARDHQLKGDAQHLRQCHIKDDLLLQYERDDKLKIITLADIGTHHQLLEI